MKITTCQVNHMNNPIGFSMREMPAFHWIVEDAKGTKAKESRIIVWKAPLRTLSELGEKPSERTSPRGSLDALFHEQSSKGEPSERTSPRASLYTAADGKKNGASGESGLTLAADTGMGRS